MPLPTIEEWSSGVSSSICDFLNHEVNEILVDKREAAVVRLIFDKYVNKSYGIQRMVKYLLAEGIRKPERRKFR